MSRFRIVSAVAVVLTLAACSGSGSDPLGPERGPRMNGGLVVGGNDNPSDSTATNTNSAPSSSGDNVPVQGDSVPPLNENGGLVVGGN
ncbi:MAG TPA: hypothetical protein VF665_13305 [Longimicrobium sp.]|uniref:hypothetical protein n=1 Tax=Longimicrobium sp. TaxID=2029185 RepID=UPI002ED8373B